MGGCERVGGEGGRGGAVEPHRAAARSTGRQEAPSYETALWTLIISLIKAHHCLIKYKYFFIIIIITSSSSDESPEPDEGACEHYSALLLGLEAFPKSNIVIFKISSFIVSILAFG